jgi:hypothetical protein
MGSIIGMSIAFLAALFFVVVRISGGKKEADKCDDFTKGAAWFFTFICGAFGLLIMFSPFIKKAKEISPFLIYIFPIAAIFIAYKIAEWLVSTEEKE